jgi:hypothetical protein
VVVEARPTATLEVIEAQFALELLVAALDLPAFLPEADHLLNGGIRGQVREGVLDGAVFPPLHQEPARQPGAIAAGPLDPDLLDHPEVTCPRQERSEARRRRWDTPGSQAPAELIERHPDVLIGVGVDTDCDPNLAIVSRAAV